MKSITRRQQQTLDFIKKFMASNDYSPSMRTIMEEVTSYHSTSCVKRDLVALERLGLIERMPNKARSIRIVEQGDSLEKQIESLQGKLKVCKESWDEQKEQIRSLEHALSNANLYAGEYYTWVPYYENHLETLSMPVMIEADWLRQLITLEKKPLQQEIEKLREIQRTLALSLHNAIKNPSSHTHEGKWFCHACCKIIPPEHLDLHRYGGCTPELKTANEVKKLCTHLDVDGRETVIIDGDIEQCTQCGAIGK